MRVVALTLFLLLATRLAAPSEAMAQYHQVSGGLAVGGTLGATSTDGSERVGGGPETTALLELPLGDQFRLRAEGGVAAWHYKGEPFNGVPGSAMRRYRLNASLIRSPRALSPMERFQGYAGGGVGFYVNQLADGQDSGSWGGHGVAGIEILLPTRRSRWIVGGELQLHLFGEPRGARPETIPILAGHASLVVKYRLP